MGFLFLKLPPPPCAVLLVEYVFIYIYMLFNVYINMSIRLLYIMNIYIYIYIYMSLNANTCFINIYRYDSIFVIRLQQDSLDCTNICTHNILRLKGTVLQWSGTQGFHSPLPICSGCRGDVEPGTRPGILGHPKVEWINVDVWVTPLYDQTSCWLPYCFDDHWNIYMTQTKHFPFSNAQLFKT